MAIAGPPITARPRRASRKSKHTSAGIARAKGKGKKKAGKKRGKKKAGKKRGKKRAKRRTKKAAAPRKRSRRRRRKGQKGPNIISHKDPDGLGKGRVKCPARKVAVATVAKHRRSGTYVFHARCV